MVPPRSAASLVVVLDDLVRYDPGWDAGGPADHFRDAEGPFPICVLLATKRGHAGVRPGIHVRPVVGAVDDDRVLRNTEFVEQVEQVADMLVVVDHRVVVRRLPAPAWPTLCGFVCVLRCMCVVFIQTKKGVSAACWFAMKSLAAPTVSSSIVSIRVLVSGPVSSIRCFPTRPNRPCSVESSTSVAQEWMTPRGPKRSLKCGKSSAGGQFGSSGSSSAFRW
jgi:hypothetical protein